jgi:hypothetical protein
MRTAESNHRLHSLPSLSPNLLLPS